MQTNANMDSHPSVLIADDISDALKHELTVDNPGCRLVFANSKAQVELLLKQSRFDLILLNPDIVGGLLTSIQDPLQLNHNVPAVALVGTPSLQGRRKLISVGYDDCIGKPLTTELFKQVRNLWLTDNEFETIVFAIAKLMTKVNNNRQLVLTLWEHLLEELPVEMAKFGHALKQQDFKTAYDVIHKINGSVKICCVSEVEKLADEIEKCLVVNQYEVVYKKCPELNKRISILTNQRQKIFSYLITL